MRLIGLCGYAQVGKDTAAKPLIEAGWKRAAFADLLKADIRRLLEIAYDDTELSGHVLPDLDSSHAKSRLRPLLVEYGRSMRMLHPTIWVDRLFRRLNLDERYVITDVRYANEAARIRKDGGTVVGIVRPGVSWANDEERRSMSEFSPDLTIVNDGSVEDLYARVRYAFLGFE